MNYGAYLVARLRPDGTFKLGIFSEPHPSRDRDWPSAVVGETKSHLGFQEARDELVSLIRRGHWGRWIPAFMGEAELDPPLPELP